MMNNELEIANKTIDLLIEREEELVKDINVLKYNTGISFKLNERVGYRISENLIIKQLQERVQELENELEDVLNGLDVLGSGNETK